MKALWGIRVEEHVETAGLDVAEHGMWGYPEFYIPVPGGYGTESHPPPRPSAARTLRWKHGHSARCTDPQSAPRPRGRAVRQPDLQAN